MMSQYLCLSVKFLDPVFYGKRSGGEPEWPPSPLRLFQALVAAAARVGGGSVGGAMKSSLAWLSGLPHGDRERHLIVAPREVVGRPYRLSVPNNDMDAIAGAWVRGQEPRKQPAELRTLKPVRPTRLVGGDTVYYLWQLPDEPTAEELGHIEMVTLAARHLIALGWGIDLVAGRASVVNEAEVDRLVGERWSPVSSPRGGIALPVPTRDTLRALDQRYRAFLNRVSGTGFTPVPQLPQWGFGEIYYHRDSSPAPRPYAAFQLLKPNASAPQIYNPVRRTHVVAGMARGITRAAAEAAALPAEWVESFVCGHGNGQNGQACGTAGAQRFMYLPLPSIEPRRRGGPPTVVTDIRRLLLVEPIGGTGEQVQWAKQSLSGRELVPEPDDDLPPALLALLPDDDSNIQNYVQSSPSWATVTPVLLPGLGNRTSQETEDLLRASIRHSGLPAVLARHAVIGFRRVGFWPGVDLSTRYHRPKHLEHYPRYHVRIEWRDADGLPVPVQGPLSLGAGRFYGLGLFAAERG
jgi:CRISPR-associated protein Csb2